MNKILIVNRAVPGSGKSTIANNIAAEVRARGGSAHIHSTDDYFLQGNRYVFDVAFLGEYHRRNIEAATISMRSGTHLVICDNTNLCSWQAKPYTDVARVFGYRIVLIDYAPRDPQQHIESQKVSDTKPDAHGVPAETIKEMIEEYHRFSPLLSKTYSHDQNPLNYQIWDTRTMALVSGEGPLLPYDYDDLITVPPEEYGRAKQEMGERIARSVLGVHADH